MTLFEKKRTFKKVFGKKKVTNSCLSLQRLGSKDSRAQVRFKRKTSIHFQTSYRASSLIPLSLMVTPSQKLKIWEKEGTKYMITITDTILHDTIIHSETLITHFVSSFSFFLSFFHGRFGFVYLVKNSKGESFALKQMFFQEKDELMVWLQLWSYFSQPLLLLYDSENSKWTWDEQNYVLLSSCSQADNFTNWKRTKQKWSIPSIAFISWIVYNDLT